MKMQHRYKHKLFVYYFTVFALLTFTFIAFQYHREKKFKIDKLETTLGNITEMTNLYMLQKDVLANGNMQLLDSFSLLIPQAQTRLTVIDRKGKVLYDNFVADYQRMENHLERPEVQKALYTNFGSNIRHSSTTGEDFYYYARFYDEYFVRIAVVYNIKIREFLKAERLFFLVVVFGFVVAWLVLSYVTDKMGKNITLLKDLASDLVLEKPSNKDISFPDNEIGVIGEHLITLHNRFVELQKEQTIRQEKLERLLFVLKEGVGFFSPRKELVLGNSRFTEYINRLALKSSIKTGLFFKVEQFKQIHDFIDQYTKPGKDVIQSGNLPTHEISLVEEECHIMVKCIVFKDRSFMVVIDFGE